jgi:hypothetical protein
VGNGKLTPLAHFAETVTSQNPNGEGIRHLTLAKNARMGHPLFGYEDGKIKFYEAWAARQLLVSLGGRGRAKIGL